MATTTTITTSTQPVVDTNATGEPQQTLVSRLSNYTIVNSLYQGYSTIKESNSYLKAGLQTAENLTQPVLKKLDDTLHLDKTGVAILDKIENTTTDLTTKVTDYYTQSVDYVNTTKDTAVETGFAILSNANRPVNQLLDVTEKVVNKILPPEFPVPPLESDDEGEEVEVVEYTGGSVGGVSTLQTDGVYGESEAERLASNPLPRIKQMSTGVGKRLQLRTQRQLESMGYVVDLIQYAADYIDLDGKTKLLKENASNVQGFIEEQKGLATTKYVIPAKEIIEQQTSDIKEQGIKAIVAVVASFAHITEVVRRQVENNVPSVQRLQEHLRNVTERTKNAILKLKESDLHNYINMVRETYVYALHNILELTAYVPTKVFDSLPILSHLMKDLSSWRLSLTARLALKKPPTENDKEKECHPTIKQV